jgi:hypothetical protein
MQIVRIAIVTDVYCDDPNAERQEIVTQFKGQLEDELDGDQVDVRVVASGRGVHEVADKNVDVLILDYGAATFGSRDMGIWQVGDGCRWAEEHPGRVLLLWTSFTNQLYKDELEREYGHLTNIIYRYEEPYDLDDAGDPVLRAIAKWIGLVES